VLAVPRGGLPVAREVADWFSVPLDVIAAKKRGAPGNPELAVGAVARDGSVWLHEELVADLGVSDDYLAALRALADDVVCVSQPSRFRAVAQAYRSFPQVSDTAARTHRDG
jgi:predicted phosphoribosyltransferase